MEYCKEVKSGNFRTETVQTQKAEIKTELTPQYKIITSLLPESLPLTINPEGVQEPGTGKIREFYLQDGSKVEKFTFIRKFYPNILIDEKGVEYNTRLKNGELHVNTSQLSTSRNYSVIFEFKNGGNEFVTNSPFNDINKAIDYFDRQGIEVLAVLGAVPFEKIGLYGQKSQAYTYHNFESLSYNSQKYEYTESLYSHNSSVLSGSYVLNLNGKFENRQFVLEKDFEKREAQIESLKSNPDVISITVNSWGPIVENKNAQPDVGQARAANVYKDGKLIAFMLTPSVSFQEVLKLAQRQYGEKIQISQLDGDFQAKTFVIDPKNPGAEFNQPEAAKLLTPQLLVRKKVDNNMRKVNVDENGANIKFVADKFCDLRDSNKVKDKTRGFFKF